MKRRIYQLLFCKLLGWTIEGSFDKSIKKCVIIVIPHTSWHDFYIAVLFRGVLNLEINWIGKQELFKFPLKYYFKYMGGAPIDRSGGLDKVAAIASIFKEKKIFRLALSPEGTRSKVTSLKSGFYFIATQAQVPIVPIAFDYENKQVKIGKSFFPTDNYQNDLPLIINHFKDVKGKVENNSFDVF